MTLLSTKARNKLPAKSFAGPDRSYPINDPNHARNALARVANKSPALKERVRAAVHKKFPEIGNSGPEEHTRAAERFPEPQEQREAEHEPQHEHRERAPQYGRMPEGGDWRGHREGYEWPTREVISPEHAMHGSIRPEEPPHHKGLSQRNAHPKASEHVRKLTQALNTFKQRKIPWLS